MIEIVRISYFRSLREVEVRLRPLTVLVGPNDSGKTSFLDALMVGLEHRGARQEDRWRLESVPTGIDLWRDPNNRFKGVGEIYRLPSQGVPMKSRGLPDPPSGTPPLESEGGNLAAFFDFLLRKDRRRFLQIEASLKQLVPGFEEILISTPAAEERAISLSIEHGLKLPGDLLSTGVRMLLFFVALAHHPNPPDLVLIEEPENGVHPRRLKEIVDLLRGLTEGRLGGKQVQVILTTHSPCLLDQVRIPQDQVLVFERHEDGSRTAREVDAARLKTFLDEFMLGEVWFNQGEEGLVSTTR